MFDLMRTDRDNFFDDFFYARSWTPAVDVTELKDKYVIEADLPGVEEKDIKVEFTDGTLVIEGSRARHGAKDPSENEGTRIHLRERSASQFKRAFVLEEGIQPEKIQASYRNGTLCIEVPKAERALPRSIPISVTKH